MHGFASMHEARRNAKTFARRHELHGDVGALAHATHDEFAARLLCFGDSVDSVFQTQPRDWTHPVECSDVG